MSFQEQLNKETNPNIRMIAKYLLSRDDIKENLEKPDKSLKQMWAYIVSEAKKVVSGGCACVADEDVYSWAVHYYDENSEEIDYVPMPRDFERVSTSEVAVEDDSKNKIIEELENKVQVLEQKLDAIKCEQSVTAEEPKEKGETVAPKAKKKKKVTTVPDEQLSMFDFLVR